METRVPARSRRSPWSDKPAWFQYVLSLSAVGVALGARWAMAPVLGDSIPFLTVFAVLLLLVVTVRPGPFLVAGLAGWSGSWLIFVPQGRPMPSPGPLFTLQFALFALSIIAAITAAWFADRIHRAVATDQREAEERKEALQVTLASIGDAVITTDKNGRVTFLNLVAEQLTGWSNAEAEGQPLQDVIRIINEESRLSVENPVDKVFNAGTTVGLAPRTLLIRKDGSEVSIDDNASPIRDPEGHVTGVVLVFPDFRERRAAEERLVRSEQELSEFFDNASVALHWLGADGTILRANKAELALLGYAREQYVGRNISEFHVDSPVIEDMLIRLANGETLRDCPARLRCKDGSIREVLVESSALIQSGTFVHTRCFTMDLTELKKAQKATELLAAIVEASNDAVISETPEGLITSWNAGAEGIFGFAREEALGKTIDFIIPPELREEEQSMMARLRHGELFEHFETKRITKDGHRIDVSLTLSPVRDNTGRIIGASKVAREITERRRRDLDNQFLAAANASLASLVDHDSTLQTVAHLAVPNFADWCTVDLLGPNQSLRRVAVAHIDPDKVRLAHELCRLMPPDPTANTGVWEIIRSGKSELISEVTDEMISSAKKDKELLETMWALGVKSYVGVPLTVRGRVLGVMTFVSAESGRRYTPKDQEMAEDLAHRAAIAIENTRLYDEVRRADRRKDEFLATLAHELRNPLAPIRTALAIVKTTQDPEPLGKAREVMERQVDQMVRLVDDLMDISRITRDKLDMRMARVELAPIIDLAVETARPIAEPDGHSIEVRVPSETIYLQADAMRLTQVFSNLLNNACKFTDPQGKITISVERHISQVVVSVRDNGMGIPADKIDRIFEMFEQIDTTQQRSPGGLGIGLTLVKRVVELHGGTVSAASEGVGQGSVFHVRLAMSEIQTPATVEENTDTTAVTANLRVLVVDDNVDAATVVGIWLTRSGYQVRLEHNGKSAVDAAAEFHPDVVLLDIGLPDVDGYEACRRIRLVPQGQGAYMIALTGWGQAEDKRRSAEAGFDLHLVKPVDPKALLKLVSEFGAARLDRL